MLSMLYNLFESNLLRRLHSWLLFGCSTHDICIETLLSKKIVPRIQLVNSIHKRMHPP